MLLSAGPLEEEETRYRSSSRNAGNHSSFSQSSVPFPRVNWKPLGSSTWNSPFAQKIPNQVRCPTATAYLFLILSFFPYWTRVGERGQPSQGVVLPSQPWRAPPAGFWRSCFLGSKGSPPGPTSTASNCASFCKLPTCPHTRQRLTKFTFTGHSHPHF